MEDRRFVDFRDNVGRWMFNRQISWKVEVEVETKLVTFNNFF